MKKHAIPLLLLSFFCLCGLIGLIASSSNATFYPPGINRSLEKENPIQITSQGKEKKVLIYCTHYWESYLPDLNRSITNPDVASDSKKNVTMVGKRLVKELQREGIGSLFVTQRYSAHKAYKKSGKMVRTTLRRAKDVTYFIDIHRDLKERNRTTLSHHKKTYARVLFVVGSSSTYYQDNLKLARSLHRRLNAYYPGISEAVIVKDKGLIDNGEYNQSLSPHSLLIEVGGYQNSFDEAYRTMRVLAHVLGDKMKKEIPVSSMFTK